MLRADLLPFPSFAAVPAVGTVRSAIGSTGQGYTPLGHEVARDVQQFIAQGSGHTATVMQSPQAQWLAAQALKQRVQTTSSKAENKVSRPAEPASAKGGASLQPAQQAFLQRIRPWAQAAADRLGVSVNSVMAHAALESGWGQKPLRDAQGNDALNLFGIKAFANWQGASTQALTTEYEDGQAVQQAQAFRQYGGLEETFADYVGLLAHNPRYRQALHTGNDVAAFAQALAAGGYATDPDYAQKLVRVSRVIPTLP